MEGEQQTVEQTITSSEQPLTIEEKKPEETPATEVTEIKPASEGSGKLENTPENQEQNKLNLNLIFLVSKKIEEVFSVLTKFESESDEKEKKFWNEISELKCPLGEILDDSKLNKFLYIIKIIYIFKF